jgi:DNA-binding MarR family transcriptional regulator
MAKFYGFQGFKERCGGCDMVRMVDYFWRDRLCRECMGERYLSPAEGKVIRTIAEHGTIDRNMMDAIELKAVPALIARGLVEAGTAEGDARRTVYSVTHDGRIAIDLNPTAEEVFAANAIPAHYVWKGWA